MSTSSIEWTDRVWNPTIGCTKVSAGCKHCYAETMHARLTGMGQAKYAEPFRVVKPWPAQLADPLRWKKPARIFVNSMSDLFHEDVPDEYIAAVFGVMGALNGHHTFQVLTKRAKRMAQWVEWATNHVDFCEVTCNALDAIGFERGCGSTFDLDVWPLPNVWLGVSVENQEQADARIPHLLRVPAAVRFLSCEPLLGPVDLNAVPRGGIPVNGFPPSFGAFASWQETPMRAKLRDGIDWVIVGGESGHGARPIHPDWARSIRDQCVAAGVAFHFKQWGQWSEIEYDRDNAPGDRAGERYLNAAGGHGFHGENVVRIRIANKNTNGRLLDGRTWDEFPTVRP